MTQGVTRGLILDFGGVVSRTLFERLDVQRPGLKTKILTQIARQLSSRLRQANTEIAALRS